VDALGFKPFKVGKSASHDAALCLRGSASANKTFLPGQRPHFAATVGIRVLDDYNDAYYMQGMDENVFSKIGDLSRLARRSFDARARQIGVTRQQWQVLVTLRRHEGVNQGGLAELLDVEPISVCRMVDRLQEADLVERRPDPADRRSWRLFLTAKAEVLLAQLRPLADEMEAQALEGITPAQRDDLYLLLDAIRQNLMPRSAAGLVSHG
jgi:DNA-binding MarR family transcriptional regulator